MLEIEQEYERTGMASACSEIMMYACQYRAVPVVPLPTALRGRRLRDELHAYKVFAVRPTHIGLVELGVGFISAGAAPKRYPCAPTPATNENCR